MGTGNELDGAKAKSGARRIGNVYYARFRAGQHTSGETELDEMIGDIRRSVESINAASCRIAEDNSELARLCGESSKKIVSVIGVIDGVAFESNLLALNAAVEASRCGSGGRDIGLVAAEIRNLVQKSAVATREIHGLLRDTVRKVEGGARLVDEVGATMDEIVAAVKQVTEVLSEISAANAPDVLPVDIEATAEA